MKKITFFLCALLISAMSFAQVTFSPANETAVESKKFTLTSGDVTLVCSSGTITADQFRFFKSQTVTISSTGGNIVSVEFTCTASGAAKYGPGCFTANSGDYTYSGKVGTWTGEANEVTFTASSNQVRATQVVVTLLAAGGVPQPSIQGATDFIESAEVSIVASEGLKVYYTLDGTDPTTESTEYTAPFTVEETTTVKAIAHDGTNASDVTETTFTKATKVTCAEAAEIASQLSGNNVLSDLYYVVVGYVTELDGTISNGQQKFWVSDTKGGANTLYSYWCNVPQELVVGDYIQMFGKLTKFNEKNQMKNGDVTIAEEPVIEEPTIECKDALDFGAVAYNAEVAAQTLEVAAYNLTSDITVTLSEGAAFIVDQTTLSAEGGNLVVTPVSPLTVGTHNATLTLASGEATAEVTLTIVAKDVYTIAWYVNGELYDETTVVEGDNLVLPVAPEAPEACSEKVFVGWTAAEEVNTDGSEIEWVTAATAPTATATYYAVFAAQEGEGGQEEVSASVTIADYATANSWTNGEQYPSITIDTNITATAAGESNTGKYYTSGNQWRFYQGEGATLTITAAEGITISTVAVTYAIQNTGILTLDGVNIESEAICNINASSVTFGVGNTGSVANGQVRVTKINVTYFAGAAATYTDYSTTCEPEIPTYSVTVSDNTGGFEPITTGGGEYKEGDNATVTASEEVEGWVFVGWMANEEFVANDPTYTFAVEGNTELVAIYATAMEDEITNLVIDPYMMVLIGGPSTTWQVEVTLGLGEDNGEGGFLLSDESYVSIMGEDATWIDGMAFDIDLDANVATAIVVVEFGGTYYAFTLTMSAAPAEPIEVVVENATVTLSKYTVSETESAYELTMVADWTYEKDGLTYEVECLLPTFDPTNESGNYAANFFVRGDGDAFGMAEGANVLVTVENQTLKLTGEISAFNGNVYNVTISGTLPAVPSALDNVTTTVAPVKAIVNGQLVIVKDGVQYNAQGAVIK